MRDFEARDLACRLAADNAAAGVERDLP